MRRPTHAMRFALPAVFVLCGGCATTGAPSDDPGHVSDAPTGASTQVVTRAELLESNSNNAWEALRDHVKFVFFREDVRGRPQMATRRGNTSMLGPQDVRVLVDGTPVGDIRDLTLIPVEDIREIRVLTGVDATTYFGTNSVSGAVLITTR